MKRLELVQEQAGVGVLKYKSTIKMSWKLTMFIHKIIYLKNYGTYMLGLDEYKSIGNHWIALDVNADNVSASYNAAYVDCFRAEHIPKKI